MLDMIGYTESLHDRSSIRSASQLRIMRPRPTQSSALGCRAGRGVDVLVAAEVSVIPLTQDGLRLHARFRFSCGG